MSRFAWFTLRVAAIGMVLVLPRIPVGSAHAELLDQLKGATGTGQSGGLLGGLGSGGVPSVGQAGQGNTAGLLQYCFRNNYVNGGAAGSIKDSLMSKVTGSGRGTNDSGYQSGNKGILDTGGGQAFSLGGDGIKAQITQKVCEQILQHAKSFL